MKILLTFLFLTTTCIAYSDTIVIIRQGGKDNKYNRVTESHNEGNHRLSCTGTGNNECGWNIPPSIGGEDVIEIEIWVQNQIDDGKNNGVVRYNNKVEVSWTKNEKSGEVTIRMNDHFRQ